MASRKRITPQPFRPPGFFDEPQSQGTFIPSNTPFYGPSSGGWDTSDKKELRKFGQLTSDIFKHERTYEPTDAMQSAVTDRAMKMLANIYGEPQADDQVYGGLPRSEAMSRDFNALALRIQNSLMKKYVAPYKRKRPEKLKAVLERATGQRKTLQKPRK